jgi:hypothetical protein
MSEADKDKKDVTIIVNGSPQDFEKKTITFAEVVALAFPNPPSGENIDYTVMFSHGPHDKPQGTLLPGQDVEVVNKMRFDVTPTDRS